MASLPPILDIGEEKHKHEISPAWSVWSIEFIGFVWLIWLSEITKQ
jgi:hypothetical protein